MIIKKKFAHQVSPQTSAPKHREPEHFASVSEEQVGWDIPSAPPVEVDPYEEVELTPEVFESGQLPERRMGPRNERRTGFRRYEDQELISLAQEEANAIREAAAEEGFQQGMLQAQETVADLDAVIQQFLNAKEEAILSVSKEIADMAVEIAERIIKTEVSCDEAIVMAVVRNTVAKVGREQKSILIKVNAVDLKLVKDSMKADSQISESVEVLVSEDAEVDPGSCIIETRAGQIDARFSTQLATLKQMLLLRGGM